ncbi:MAG: hypothetical protein PUC39_00835 [Lachnospiraceae bacterium]|nr:hypothetical protein [Lachnospiraceae bacterium]
MEEGRNYIRILRESLEKKERILHNLLDMTRQQEEYLAGSEFELDVFEEMLDVKNGMIEELNSVDDGFETVYERIREYLQSHQKELAEPIREMQNRVREITSLSVSLQALEERNRKKLEGVFASKQQEIKKFRQSSQMVNNYYQTMSGAGSYQPSFLDKKK